MQAPIFLFAIKQPQGKPSTSLQHTALITWQLRIFILITDFYYRINKHESVIKTLFKLNFLLQIRQINYKKGIVSRKFNLYLQDEMILFWYANAFKEETTREQRKKQATSTPYSTFLSAILGIYLFIGRRI